MNKNCSYGYIYIHHTKIILNNISFGCRTYVDSLLFRTISMHGRTERILYGNEFRIIYILNHNIFMMHDILFLIPSGLNISADIFHK